MTIRSPRTRGSSRGVNAIDWLYVFDNHACAREVSD
jgi:hypothetical protein